MVLEFVTNLDKKKDFYINYDNQYVKMRGYMALNDLILLLIKC